jgi:hypothetical protein
MVFHRHQVLDISMTSVTFNTDLLPANRQPHLQQQPYPPQYATAAISTQPIMVSQEYVKVETVGKKFHFKLYSKIVYFFASFPHFFLTFFL